MNRPPGTAGRSSCARPTAGPPGEGAWADAVRRARRLGELLRPPPAAREPDPRSVETARRIVRLWRTAVGGGAEVPFRRRLAWDGLPAGEELVRRIARALAAPPEEPPWLGPVLPLASVPAAEVPRALARWAGEEIARRCPTWTTLPEAARSAYPGLLARQARELLQRCGAPPGAPAGAVLVRHPAAARWIGELAQGAVDGAVRLLNRLEADRRKLAALFGPAVLDPPSLVEPGLSDRHGGDTVIRVVWPRGPVLYCKPRPLTGEAALARWIAALREAGVPLARPPRQLERSDHGWVEEVPEGRLSGSGAAREWWRAAGALAALAWLLGLSDLHAENVVASPQGPVIVDAETLAVPETVLDPPERGHDGILATGLVTFPMPGRDGTVRDRGALLGDDPAAFRSLPRLHGEPVEASRFHREAAEGCAAALRALARLARSGDATPLLAGLERLRCRWVPRPSDLYARTLEAALEPRALRAGWSAGLLAEALLRPLVTAHAERPPWWELVRREREALERLEVPRLELPVSARRATATERALVRRWGNAGVAVRLRRAGREAGVLAAELAAALAGSATAGDPGTLLLRGAAHRIATELAGSQHRYPEGLERSLARGAPGVALALAAWARAAGDEEAARAARRLLRTHAPGIRRGEGTGPPGSVGLCTGVGGAAYALAAAGTLLESPDLVDAAVEVLQNSPPAVPGDPLDVEGGLAGWILCACAVLAVAPDPTVREGLAAAAAGLAAAAGDRTPHRPGFAHGRSGTAAALAVAARVLDDPGLAHAATTELLAEPDRGRWRAAADTDEHGPVAMAAWCHGPPGALLARWMVLAGGGEVAAGETEAALAATLAAPLAGPVHLCCGILGRAEILLTGGRWLERDDLRRFAVSRTHHLVRSRGWAVRTPALEPSLFFGSAGVLLHLSRCADPASAASVLAAEPPRTRP